MNAQPRNWDDEHKNFTSIPFLPVALPEVLVTQPETGVLDRAINRNRIASGFLGRTDEKTPFTNLVKKNSDKAVALSTDDQSIARLSHFEIRPLLPHAKRVASLQPLQEWEGHVTYIYADSFDARLRDVTARQSVETESAEFPKSDISMSDEGLLREGAVFRWVIGYLLEPNGVKRRVSQIVFRRLPAWTQQEVSEARRKANNIFEAITWES